MEYPEHIVAVGTLIQNKQGLFLLVRTEWRGWEIPGGQVEEGEDLISALKREVAEESGIGSLGINKMAAIYSSINEPHKVILDFIAECEDNDIQGGGEILEVRWFSREEVLSIIQSDSMKYRVQWLLENRDSIRLASYAKAPFKVLSETVL